ncbi:MAG: hypothetical protein KDD64_11685 [Bdellovibrionales bacterium]|nr:hypothetical protein [Bdellovibrionales bacterium]
MNSRFLVISILFPLAISPLAALGQTLVEQDQVTQVQVQLGTRKLREISCYQGKAGLGKAQSDSLLRFTPLSKKLSWAKKRFGEESQKARNLKKLARLGKKACRQAQAQSYFDSERFVTELGKSTFEIPDSLSASVDAGEEIYLQYCTLCHEPRVNRTFSEYRAKIALPPMNFSEEEIDDQTLADLTAYLNRLRQAS